MHNVVLGCIVFFAAVAVAQSAFAQWTYDRVGDLLLGGGSRGPATAQEAVLLASQAIRHFGRAAEPLESYARCLTRGIIEPDSPRNYLNLTEDVDRIRSGNAMPTTSFEAALFVARVWSSAGADTARPFFRLYADRCWSIPSQRPRTAGIQRSASTAETVEGTISERGLRRYRYRVNSNRAEQMTVSVSWATPGYRGLGIAVFLQAYTDDTSQIVAQSAPALRRGTNRMELGLLPDTTYDVVLQNIGTATTFTLRTTGNIAFLGEQ